MQKELYAINILREISGDMLHSEQPGCLDSHDLVKDSDGDDKKASFLVYARPHQHNKNWRENPIIQATYRVTVELVEYTDSRDDE